jgi:beta-lactamase class C
MARGTFVAGRRLVGSPAAAFGRLPDTVDIPPRPPVKQAGEPRNRQENMRPNTMRTAIAALCLCLLPPATGRAADDESTALQTIVADTVRPIVRRYHIPGMAVGITLHGQAYVYDYGEASKATAKPVTHDTLFEIGSISKAFTATLASYAQITGHLSLSDPASRYLPDLRGSSFDNVSLLNLGTHTPGGLQLQVPDTVTNDVELMTYFRRWKPAYRPGTYRTYSNPGIGLLGLIAARSMDRQFGALMESWLYPALGMNHTYLEVPKSQLDNYAQGYTRTDAPVRMAPGVLAEEAYGVRTTASDLLRFVEANMAMFDLDATLQRAIIATHMGYDKVGPMTQDLIWEQYHYPVDLKDLLDGNGDVMALQANPVVKIDPPSQPADDVLINKTGSTNGFGAYVAFVPGRRVGIVILGNKNYPIEARVTAAAAILTRLADDAPRH